MVSFGARLAKADAFSAAAVAQATWLGCEVDMVKRS